ncbi:MBL fold metallo-hydrolase [Lutibaculum baratangense]|uniref:Metal-dependent hydrolases of the beta-lactamase superfamily III n=1 Tax=Lutibaculum baratangense AMV1 TaxID=631454 RepID=V4RH97_9HYPH|nr:MBL fold metallo-hydrolase [Lutibaculum baratangense]ESR22655.1 Metal-dependent hydrolases of the beta-lactamase superfamily III [Lutibaculum baratangense AMV1]
MKALLHPDLVNGRTGDPALFLDFQFARRAFLFDIGDLHALPARKILRVSDAFVSHCHLDHFVGFDTVLRLSIGRVATIRLHGPEGLIAAVAQKLAAYTWNLADKYAADLAFVVQELHEDGSRRRARLRLRNRFVAEPLDPPDLPSGCLLDEPALRVRAVTLDHFIPCLAFAVEEARHLNVWRNRVEAEGLPIGPWLGPFKQAVASGAPDDTAIAIDGLPARPLRDLRHLVTVERGQKIGYVTDIRGTEANITAAGELLAGVDILFCEAAFAAEDAAVAADRGHLTTREAVEIARRAGAKRLEPFHFSPRYADQDDRLLREVREFFSGAP